MIEIAQRVRELDLDAQHVDAAEIDCGAHQDGRDDDREISGEVDAADDAHRLSGVGSGRTRPSFR